MFHSLLKPEALLSLRCICILISAEFPIACYIVSARPVSIFLFKLSLSSDKPLFFPDNFSHSLLSNCPLYLLHKIQQNSVTLLIIHEIMQNLFQACQLLLYSSFIYVTCLSIKYFLALTKIILEKHDMAKIWTNSNSD